MANHGLIVGLDVGTNTVKVLAADVRDQQVNVVGVGRAVSHGVKRGVVVDIDAAANDIRTAMVQINEQTNQPVTEVVASIPANNIQIQNVSGMVTVQDSQHISYNDVAAAVREAANLNLPADRAIIDIVPVEFIVDDFDGIQDPNDMVGMRLTMKAVAYTAPRHVLGNLRKAIEKAGLHVRDMVLSPLAESKTILSEAEQEFGAIMLDMGAGQTTATVVKDQQIRFITVFQAGSEHISRDVSAVLNIGLHDADMLKLDDGLALPSMARADNKLVINPLGEERPQEVSEEYLAEIIAARVQQIAAKVGEKLQLVSAFQLPGGVIVTGGGAALRGIPEALREMYDVNVKVFAPDDLGLRHPGYAGAWSLIHYASLQTTVQLVVKQALYNLPITAVQAPTTVAVPAPLPKSKRPAMTEPVREEEMVEKPAEESSEPKKTKRMSKFLSNFFD